jgi:hypothetical protein
MWSMTPPDIEQFGITAMNVIVKAMEEEGVITKEQSIDWLGNHTLIFRKPSLIMRVFKPSESEKYAWYVAKMV